MDVVNQAFDNGSATLQKPNTRANGITKFAFNDGMNGFDFPALAVETVQTSATHPISPFTTSRINDFAIAANGRHQIKRGHFFSIETAVGQEQPGAAAFTVASITAQFSGSAPIPLSTIDGYSPNTNTAAVKPGTVNVPDLASNAAVRTTLSAEFASAGCSSKS